jgi:hypothetical protein
MSLPATKPSTWSLSSEEEIVGLHDKNQTSVVSAQTQSLEQPKETSAIVSTTPPLNDDKDTTLYSGQREVIFVGTLSQGLPS